MEIHAHSHTPRKKLDPIISGSLSCCFLRSSVDFWAENLREHKVERHREKQYMESLVEDLKSDTLMLEDKKYFPQTEQVNDDRFIGYNAQFNGQK